MWGMGSGTQCEQVREQLSARLDGEEDEADRARRALVDTHVAGCAECAQWWDRVRMVTRMARTSAALPTPALSAEALDSVLAAAPAGPPRTARSVRAARVLRLALLAVGLAQFFLGIAQIANLAGIADTHTHDGGVPVSSGHLWHESASWNVAIGAALAWLAWQRTRPASLLPVMTAFIAVLGLLTLNDALAGRVDTDRVLSHGLLLAGYALLLVLHHPRLRGQQPPAGRVGRPSAWSIGGGDSGDGEDGPSAVIYPFPVRAQVQHEKRAA